MNSCTVILSHNVYLSKTMDAARPARPWPLKPQYALFFYCAWSAIARCCLSRVWNTASASKPRAVKRNVARVALRFRLRVVCWCSENWRLSCYDPRSDYVPRQCMFCRARYQWAHKPRLPHSTTPLGQTGVKGFLLACCPPKSFRTPSGSPDTTPGLHGRFPAVCHAVLQPHCYYHLWQWLLTLFGR